MAQRFTSANTSINSKKLPSVYGKLESIVKKYGIYGGAMLDYGCGKYTDHLQDEAKRFGFSVWRGYDKYNQTEAHNYIVKGRMDIGLFDMAVCSNVLNVIDDDATVQEVIREVISAAEVSVFTVYEGDGSGIGRQTKADCYQRNQKLHEYLRWFGFQRGVHVEVYKGCIICDKRIRL